MSLHAPTPRSCLHFCKMSCVFSCGGDFRAKKAPPHTIAVRSGRDQFGGCAHRSRPAAGPSEGHSGEDVDSATAGVEFRGQAPPRPVECEQFQRGRRGRHDLREDEGPDGEVGRVQAGAADRRSISSITSASLSTGSRSPTCLTDGGAQAAGKSHTQAANRPPQGHARLAKDAARRHSRPRRRSVARGIGIEPAVNSCEHETSSVCEDEASNKASSPSERSTSNISVWRSRRESSSVASRLEELRKEKEAYRARIALDIHTDE